LHVLVIGYLGLWVCLRSRNSNLGFGSIPQVGTDLKVCPLRTGQNGKVKHKNAKTHSLKSAKGEKQLKSLEY
jgi:hypothetical protein